MTKPSFVSPFGFPADTIIQVWDTRVLGSPAATLTVPYVIGTLQAVAGAKRVFATSDNRAVAEKRSCEAPTAGPVEHAGFPCARAGRRSGWSRN